MRESMGKHSLYVAQFFLFSIHIMNCSPQFPSHCFLQKYAPHYTWVNSPFPPKLGCPFLCCSIQRGNLLGNYPPSPTTINKESPLENENFLTTPKYGNPTFQNENFLTSSKFSLSSRFWIQSFLC